MEEQRKVTETRDVSGFDRVALGGFGLVTITQGDRESLTIEADEDVMPRIEVEGRDRTLYLGLERKGWLQGLKRKKLAIRFDVSMVDVAGLTLSGVGRIDAPKVRSNSISVTVSGAGALEISELKANSIDVILSGAGSCEIAGEVESQSVVLSGAGSYMASELSSDTASAVVSGAGDVTMLVNRTLDARVSGTGSIRYRGGPTVRQRVTGAGSVRCICD